MIHGDLDRLHLGDLLQWFQMGGLSGRLTLTERNNQRHLDLIDGQIVYASSNVPSERLASWLATEGLLPVSQLRRLLAVSLLRRTQFTSLLLDRGGFSPDQLQRSLTRLAETIASRVLGSSRVRFVLDPAYPVRELLGLTLQVDPNVLVMEAARRSDEHREDAGRESESPLPFDHAAFESLFWQLVRSGIASDDRLDGEQMAQLRQLIGDIMDTLAKWLACGPGLVPLPPGQAIRILERTRRGETVEMIGLPHAAWNQMVLACAIRTPHLQHPETLYELHEHAAELQVWEEISGSEVWRRPQAGRIDELTSAAAEDWSRAVEVVAPHLGAAARSAQLALHLVMVPTDLVLWVLATLPIPYRRLRAALARELPRRIGSGLARLADFPEPFRGLFENTTVTPLGACLHLARGVLPTAQVWPPTIPEDESLLLEVASPATLREAAAAAREALGRRSTSPAAAV